MNKSLFRFIIISFISVLLYITINPKLVIAESENLNLKFCKAPELPYEVVKTVKMIVTGYSSASDQTDNTPFTTASGKQVQEGFIANNMLSFGTKVRIPELYGDKVFTVEDRMHRRKGRYHTDIWFPEYNQAKEFGAKITHIEVLES